MLHSDRKQTDSKIADWKLRNANWLGEGQVAAAERL
jgi:hypothetical protein